MGTTHKKVVFLSFCETSYNGSLWNLNHYCYLCHFII